MKMTTRKRRSKGSSAIHYTALAELLGAKAVLVLWVGGAPSEAHQKLSEDFNI